MKHKIDVGAIGTFGLPNGCTQSAFYSGKFKGNKSLDLNANAIKIFPDTILFVVRREIVSNETCLVFGKYSFAKEMNSNRSGTFIGSFISFYDAYVDPNQIYGSLKELHKHLIENKNNITNSILQVNHSKDLQVKLPKDFDKLNENLRPMNRTENATEIINSSQNFVVYSDIQTEDIIVKFFYNCIDFFHNYETIYFTQSREIAEFVNNKKLLIIKSSIEFEKDIELIKIKKAEDLKRLENLKIEEFNRLELLKKEEEIKIAEQKRIEEEKKQDAENRKRILTKKNPPNHQHIKYDVFKNLIIDYNKLLDMYSDQQLTNDALQRSQNSLGLPSHNRQKRVSKNDKSRPTSVKAIFYLFIPALCFFLFASNLYFLFQEPKIEYSANATATAPETEIHAQTEENILNPMPNNELNKSEKELIFNDTINGKKINEITKLIFKNNPEEISKIYSFQKYSYQLNLYQLNAKYFKINVDTICINDSIEKIPSFKRVQN